MDDTKRQFILLPREGIRATTERSRSAMVSVPYTTSTGSPISFSLEAAEGASVQVLDSIHEDGPKLVELDEAAEQSINDEQSPLRAIPIVMYPRPNPRLQTNIVAATATTTTFVISCTDPNTGNAVAGTTVVAFDNFVARTGDMGDTDANGDVQLTLNGNMIDRLYAYSPPGFWGAFRRNLPIAPRIVIDCESINFNYVDAIRHYYNSSRFDANLGVTVGIVDSGVGPHQQLNLIGGRNTVTGEPSNLFQDGNSHGTHVAGLVGVNSGPPNGFRGISPGVNLRSYRVFGQSASGASNYAILKAMIFAAEDGCDIANLSLGGGPFDEIVEEAVKDARNNGILVICAAGNNDRHPVNFPAAYSSATAISALGRQGTFPNGSLGEGDVLRPPHSNVDSNEFIAGFSNVGPQIEIVGPGVDVLSTLPNDEYGPMSGTSMAAPAVAGCIASLLSQNSNIFNMNRDRARSDAIERLLQTSCIRRGFGLTFEGFGLPDPALV